MNMSMTITSLTYLDYSNCSPQFINGIEFLKRNMYAQASKCFEIALEQVRYSDVYYNKYASFCGYLRILTGREKSGLDLCKQAARSELHDADVYYNLARCEHKLNNRKATIQAIKKGLNIDSYHRPLQAFHQKIGIRSKKPLPFLKRSNPLNQLLGKRMRKNHQKSEKVLS